MIAAQDQTLRLKDGHQLGYTLYGDPQGKPVFFFHGWPSFRVEGRFLAEPAVRLGISIIAVDRPGFGLSDFKAGRTFLDWSEDVAELAGALGYKSFAAMDISGGGPYVAACAYKLPDRLTAAVIVSGMPSLDVPGTLDGMDPMKRLLFRVARLAPWLLNLPLRQTAPLARRSPRRSLHRWNRAVLSRRGFDQMIIDSILEAFRQGTRVAVQEYALYAQPWGFRLRDISFPVLLWQGEADTNVPLAAGRYQAQGLPHCRSSFYPGEGHYLLFTHTEEYLRH